MRLPILCCVLMWLSLPMASAQVPYDTLQPDQQAIIYFDFGQDRLRPEAEDSLRLLLEGLDRTDDRWIDIEAHTDSIGSAKANRALAMRRAQAVASWLVRMGWPAERIRKTAVGEGRPVLPNDTEEGRQANRRATITLLRRRVLTTIRGQILDDSTGVALETMV
ncbi:MAG TPA: OmpA family protein, partial [Saprospiraceae bacterium]|nr:OmpA family protein [Saprospiraceae bacterium]